jgi:hypothetical protein
MDHVAVAHGVVLAFQAELSRLLRAELAAVGDEVIVRGDLGADETALEIGRVRTPASCGSGPGA